MKIKITSFFLSMIAIAQLQASQESKWYIIPKYTEKKCEKVNGSTLNCICRSCKLSYSSYDLNKVASKENTEHTHCSSSEINPLNKPTQNAITIEKK